MREIKFRGLERGGHWLYFNIRDKDLDFWMDFFKGRIKKGTLTQYTGLRDKNGVEIYEGDIAQLYNDYDTPLEKGVVKFVDGMFVFNFNGKRQLESYIDIEMYGIIGNIYENPELLGKEKK